MKKKLILGALLLMPQQTKPGLGDDYFNKLWLFFCMELSSTFVHECGHATLIALHQGVSAIYMGVTKHPHKDTDRRVNLVSMNPGCGHTHIFKYNNLNTSKKLAQVAAAGPIYGILWNLLMYKVLGMFAHRFTPTLLDSLRTYALVGAFKELCYGAIPLSPVGDTKTVYTRTRTMSKEKYDSVAAKNLKALQDLSDFCILVAIIKKTLRTIGTQGIVDSMDNFKKNNEAFCLVYKIISLYAIKYGVIGAGLNKLIAHEKKKHKLTEPSPLDWMGGLIVAPLIM